MADDGSNANHASHDEQTTGVADEHDEPIAQRKASPATTPVGVEQQPAASSWGSWGSWVSSAKAKSSSVLEAVRKDLDELSTAVRTEVSNAGSVLGDTFRIDEPTVGQVKKSLSTFFGQVSDALLPSLDDEQDQSEAVLITTGGQVTLTGFQRHLAALQSEDETYLGEPSEQLAENYRRWLDVTEQDQFTQSRLAKHLAGSEILNEKYIALVPERCTHMQFWQRYLFRRALLEDALANAELAERRARIEASMIAQDIDQTTAVPLAARRIVHTEQPKALAADAIEDGVEEARDAQRVSDAAAAVSAANASLATTSLDEADQLEAALASGRPASMHADEAALWDADPDFTGVEISEEEQERLLLAYEQEIQEREQKRGACVPLEEKLRLDQDQADAAAAEAVANTPAPKSQPTAKKPNPSAKGPSGKRAQSAKQTTTVNTQKSSITSSNSRTASGAATSSAGGGRSLRPGKPAAVGRAGADDDGAGSDESWVKDFDIDEGK